MPTAPEKWQSKEDPDYVIEVIKRDGGIVTARTAAGDETTVFCLTQSELDFNFEMITVVDHKFVPFGDTS